MLTKIKNEIARLISLHQELRSSLKLLMYNQVKVYRLVHLVNGVSQQVTEIREL